MVDRIPLSKTIRFEVLKRDSFACQYCGKKAPDVLLQVDHIHPVAEGGGNDLLNLTTSCADCNGGKGARTLSDATVVEKQRRQLDELQERREQIEMMLDWQRGLMTLQADLTDEVMDAWMKLAPGWSPKDAHRRDLSKSIKRFGVPLVMQAMQIAADDYLEFLPDGRVTMESWSAAFEKINGIAARRKIYAEKPWMEAINHALNIGAKRFYLYPWKRGELMRDMERAYRNGMSEEDLVDLARSANTLSQWERWIFARAYPKTPEG